MFYNSLKDAIPGKWRETLKQTRFTRDAISSQENPHIPINNQLIPIHKLSNKMVYWKLVKQKQLPPISIIKWENELKIPENGWECIFNNILHLRDTRIRSFQYKLLLRLTPCNSYLQKIGKSDTTICNYCNQVDSLLHHFFECNETTLFWHSFQNWWNNMQQDKIVIRKELAILGVLKIKLNKDECKLNACLQLGRWYIYTEKLQLQRPFLYKFLCQLKYKIKIEKMIYLRNCQLEKFDGMWGELENYLD
jgi:hypothetical protein